MTAEGIRNFAADTLESYTTADRLLWRAQTQVLERRLLYGAAGGVEAGWLAARCQSNETAGAAYDVGVQFHSTDGVHTNWAHCRCSCPYGAANPACKHSLGLLLARMDGAAWGSAGGGGGGADAAAGRLSQLALG